MNGLRRLDLRLFASYALVVIVGAATLVITVVFLAPRTFDDHIHSMPMGSSSQSHDAFVGALQTSLPIAVLVSVGVAALVSAFVARRFLRPIDDVRRATRRLAAGEYDQRVPEPVELELAALAADVNALAATLETTERRRAELVSEVAHEMRTPLTTIEGYVEGILDGVFEATEKTLTAIGEETARLERLATDLGSLSRADEGHLELRRSPVDLAGLAADVAERLRPQFDDKGVGLQVQRSAPLVVDVDRDRITQVLTNLLGNALTYTPNGGRVTVTTRAAGRGASVEVGDTGVGIAPDDLGRVFDRFYRVRGLSRPAGGSGIGLTIARSIARAHGGDIYATSSGPERGATFTLVLPVSAPGAAAD
ncbi:MAG: HAMP domain-containing sensor histidine kinase [Acidimicrobiia bacterium]